ncbi:hypothetical protein WOLCODRAFT_144313 [Wolfiporia cocos MD-104 SS10]|uniref:SMP domain-containing protein n=1 Tax=Wolfiporia cocos (strain MD-104) TaxID=742152 RepID=A0A2H3JYN2_WOLCO|nr:hypothetical protein WOLCODRAFT_144313 [Wolfiporia cocos MD-104 SS10]
MLIRPSQLVRTYHIPRPFLATMSHNAGSVVSAAYQDANRFFGAGRLDLKNIGEADARKLMSAEHKALGYRPPPGSLAVSAQAEAAKHPQAESGLNAEAIRRTAAEDAARIQEKKLVNVDSIGEADARKLVSEEHKALGYRPPPGSLAAEAQAAAAKHPDATAQIDKHDLSRAALEDAERIAKYQGKSNGIDLNSLGEAEARKLMSEEHKALGYRPPPGSLAAEAQSAAAKHPDANGGVDPATLAQAAIVDARNIETHRQASTSPQTSPEVSLSTITEDEARTLQSAEQKTLGYRPPSDSVAAQAQSIIDRRVQEGTDTAAAQNLACQNTDDSSERKPGDVGLQGSERRKTRARVMASETARRIATVRGNISEKDIYALAALGVDFWT